MLAGSRQRAARADWRPVFIIIQHADKHDDCQQFSRMLAFRQLSFILLARMPT